MPIVNIPDIGNVGVIKDQPAHELPVNGFSDCQNIRFKDTNASKISGDVSILTDPAVEPHWLQIYRTPSANYLIHCGLAKVYADDGSTTRSNITGSDLTGAASDKFTGGVFQGVLVFTNGKDLPRYWGGTSNTAALTNWDANWICAALRPYKQFLFAMDVTKSSTRYASMIKWSDAAAPGTLPQWDAGNPEYLAGERDLAETGDFLVDGLGLGDSFIAYKSQSMYAMTYIGGTSVWKSSRIPGDSGMLARNCACVFPGGHVVLTAGDVVVNNGQGVQSLLSGRLRSWLFNQIDTSSYATGCFVVANPYLNEAWICYPENGQTYATQALIWNWKDDTFSLRDLSTATCATNGTFSAADSSGTWTSDSAEWDSDSSPWNDGAPILSQTNVFMGTTAPKLLRMDSGASFHGTTFTAQVERTGLDFGDKDRVKMIRAIYPRFDGTTGATVYVQVGGAMDPEAGYTWCTPVPYVIGSTFKANVIATGRLLAYRIYSTDTTNWSLASVDMDIVPQGMY